MAAITYPIELLPKPLKASYSVTDGDRILRTGIAGGYQVFRKRFGSVPAMFDVSFLMSGSQYTYFQNWIKNEINSGLNWFNMTLVTGQNLGVVHECRIAEMPKGSLNGTLWSVNVTLEANELKILPDA